MKHQVNESFKHLNNQSKHANPTYVPKFGNDNYPSGQSYVHEKTFSHSQVYPDKSHHQYQFSNIGPLSNKPQSA